MTLDFLIAMILVVFSIGAMMQLAELRTYEIKENIEYEDLQEKAEAAAIALSGGTLIGCTTENGTAVPFTYNTSVPGITKGDLGLKDYNVEVTADQVDLIAEDLGSAANVIVVDLELDKCSSPMPITGVSGQDTQTVTLKVAK